MAHPYSETLDALEIIKMKDRCPRCKHAIAAHGFSGCLHWDGTLCPCTIPREGIDEYNRPLRRKKED